MRRVAENIFLTLSDRNGSFVLSWQRLAGGSTVPDPVVATDGSIVHVVQPQLLSGWYYVMVGRP